MSKRELRLSTDWRVAVPPTYFINGTSRERVCRCGNTFRCGGKGEPPATTRWCEPCRKAAPNSKDRKRGASRKPA